MDLLCQATIQACAGHISKPMGCRRQTCISFRLCPLDVLAATVPRGGTQLGQLPSPSATGLQSGRSTARRSWSLVAWDRGPKDQQNIRILHSGSRPSRSWGSCLDPASRWRTRERTYRSHTPEGPRLSGSRLPTAS